MDSVYVRFSPSHFESRAAINQMADQPIGEVVRGAPSAPPLRRKQEEQSYTSKSWRAFNREVLLAAQSQSSDARQKNPHVVASSANWLNEASIDYLEDDYYPLTKEPIDFQWISRVLMGDKSALRFDGSEIPCCVGSSLLIAKLCFAQMSLGTPLTREWLIQIIEERFARGMPLEALLLQQSHSSLFVPGRVDFYNYNSIKEIEHFLIATPGVKYAGDRRWNLDEIKVKWDLFASDLVCDLEKLSSDMPPSSCAVAHTPYHVMLLIRSSDGGWLLFDPNIGLVDLGQEQLERDRFVACLTPYFEEKSSLSLDRMREKLEIAKKDFGCQSNEMLETMRAALLLQIFSYQGTA